MNVVDCDRMETLLKKLPDPVIYVAGAVAAIGALLKLKGIVTGDSFEAEKARYRRCNRCGKKGAAVRCNRCRRAYYCSKDCLSTAIRLEICDCC